jgi:hypothetical protein
MEVSQCLVVMVVKKGETGIATMCDECAVGGEDVFCEGKECDLGRCVRARPTQREVMQDPELPVSK